MTVFTIKKSDAHRWFYFQHYSLILLLAFSVVLEAAEVKGKVIQLRDKNLVIRLESAASVKIGDRVDLSFSVAGDRISVGRWKISGIEAEDLIEATLVYAEVDPTIGLDAVIHTAVGDTQASSTSPRAEDSPEVATESSPETLERTVATRDFSKMEKSITCETGSIVNTTTRLELHAQGKKKFVGKYCTIRISDKPLENLHALVNITVESENFLVGLFFGNFDKDGGAKGSILKLEESATGSILMTTGMMTSKSTSGSGRSREKTVVSNSWIWVSDTGGDLSVHKPLSQDTSYSNPTPGTMEFIKTGRHCRLLWKGGEMASWDESLSKKGEVRLVFNQVGRGKGKAIFDRIAVYRLDRPQDHRDSVEIMK